MGRILMRSYPCVFLAGVLTGVVSNGATTDSVAEIEVAGRFSRVFLGPIAATSSGDGLSLTATAFTRNPQGYVPTFIVWSLDSEGKRSGEVFFQPALEAQKYEQDMLKAACRLPNGDTALMTGPGHYELIRVDPRGNLVHARTAMRTAARSEVFLALAPDRGDGLWLGTKVTGASRLYHLDRHGDVLVQQEYAFDDYTVVQNVVLCKDSDELLMCGVSWPMGGSRRLWIARLDFEGQVLDMAAMPIETISPQGYELVNLPGGRAALSWAEVKDGRQRLLLRIVDRNLEALVETRPVGDAGYLSPFSMAAMGEELAILTKTPVGEGLLLVLDDEGQTEARREIQLHDSPRHSLAVLGTRLYVAGLPPGAKESTSSSTVGVLALDVHPASQSSP